MNYEQDVRIDETALDVEWLEQPSLMMKYAKHSAQMEQRASKAKDHFEVISAELDKKIRTNPDEYDLVKTTETEIRNTVQLQGEYQTAKEHLDDAEYEAQLAKYAVQAMYQRRDALENLVRLHGQQYFAGPSVPRNLSQERQKQRKANQQVKSGMKRTKRSKN